MFFTDVASGKKCPSCGANILFDANINKIVCRSCGNLYMPDELLTPSGNLDIRDVKPASDDEEKKAEYVCDTCGARVVTDENTAATFCAFCGSPSIIKRRLDLEFRPDFIVPFKVTKEVAIKNFNYYVQSATNVPKSFKKHFDSSNMTGIYVPFWLLNAKCHTDVAGSGVVINEGIKTVFNIDRTIHFAVKNVPFDGSKKISNMLMESIEPFDFDSLEYFNDNYIPGFYAQRYDESALDMTDRIRSRMDSHARQVGKFVTANEYQDCSISTESSASSDFSQSYALLPVWFVRCKYKKLNYSFAVNGQTGKVGGSLPHDESKRQRKINMFKYGVPVALALISVLLFVFGIVSIIKENYDMALGLLPWPVVIAASAWNYSPYYKRKVSDLEFSGTNTIASPPEVEEFIDLSQKIELDKRDSFGFIKMVEEEGSRKSSFRL